MISSKKPWQLKNGCSVQRKVYGALSQQPGETATIACKEKEIWSHTANFSQAQPAGTRARPLTTIVPIFPRS